MVVMYDVLGRKVASHHLAIATLSTLFIGSYLGTRGSGVPQQQTPPIKASSKEEESFIQEFLLKTGEDGKAKH